MCTNHSCLFQIVPLYNQLLNLPYLLEQHRVPDGNVSNCSQSGEPLAHPMTRPHAVGSPGIVRSRYIWKYLDVCIALCILQELQKNVSALVWPAPLGASSMVILSLQEGDTQQYASPQLNCPMVHAGILLWFYTPHQWQRVLMMTCFI